MNNKVENRLTNIFNKLLNENVLIKDNIRYFSLKDVSDLFNIKNKRDTLLKLKNTGMDNHIYDKNINGEQKMNLIFISEPALYMVLFQTRNSLTIDTKIWLCEKVLPSIRDKGMYKD